MLLIAAESADLHFRAARDLVNFTRNDETRPMSVSGGNAPGNAPERRFFMQDARLRRAADIFV